MAAGGMGRRRGPTLAERGAAARAGADRDLAPDDEGHGPGPGEPGTGDPGGSTMRPGPRRRHCWVAGPGDGSGPWPGLVVEWRRDEGGWRARVVYLVGEPDSATTVETWVDAAHLRPA
jgi:hypothetical protein